jgi:hypothetical protein
LVLWPELRRHVARLHVSALALQELLRASFAVADSLARDRTIAERTSTTPYDHLAADTIAAVCLLAEALDELERPVNLVAPSASPPDDLEL